jgi:hypothetical protein
MSMRIEIAEIENRNVYRVWHDGAVLIERTPAPGFYRDVGSRPSWRCLVIRDDPTGEFSPTNSRWQIGRPKVSTVATARADTLTAGRSQGVTGSRT